MARHKTRGSRAAGLAFLSGLLLAALLLPATTSAGALQENAGGEESYLHWAFANQLGTGIYQIGEEGELYVFRLKPITHLVLTPGTPDPSRQVLLEISLPLTLGLDRFRWAELWRGEDSPRLRQFGLAAGLGLEIPVRTSWTLRPQAYVGRGKLVDGDEERAWMYGADLNSRLAFRLAGKDFFLLNSVGWFGYASSRERQENLIGLMNGVEALLPLGRLRFKDQPLFLKAHLVNFWYFGKVEHLFYPGESPRSLGLRWELGLSVGARKRTRVLLFKLDRVGVGVHYGRGHWGLRIFFNSLFYK